MLLPRCQLERDAILMTDHVLHRRIEAQAQAIARPGKQGAHVFARAAGHHVPLRALADIQQAVIIKEAQEQRQREAAHLLQRRRPDSGPHRQDIVACEKGAKTVPLKEGLQRGARVERSRQSLLRQAIKADDLRQQPPEGRL